MVMWHLRSKRKLTGGKLRRSSKKERSMRGSSFLETTVDPRSVKVRRGHGGNRKRVLLSENIANVVDPKTKKSKKVKILAVEKNPANPHYARRDVLTKGAVIKTEIGEAVVTSRPARHGVVNAKLVEEKK